MRKVLQFLPCLLLFLASGKITTAQNLVPNGDFETFTTCPIGFSQFTGYVSDWINPSTASPDYMNSCANPNPAGVPHNGIGYQGPHSGAAYSGMYAFSGTIYREFIQVKLSSPLVAGEQYLFSMYVVLHNKSNTAVDDIGAYFSVTAPSSGSTGMLSGSPQPQVSNPFGSVITDTLTWTLISGTYTATGGEEYLTLGHLKNDAGTTYLSLPYGTIGAYYYYDDVSLTPITILPVTLTSFTGDFVASSSGNYVELNWHTATELNSCCFIIERSGDGKNFSSIGTVDAIHNSNVPSGYSFADNYPLPGENYYRLRLQDMDGTYQYSSVLVVEDNSSAASVDVTISGGVIFINNHRDHALNAVVYSTEGNQVVARMIEPGFTEWELSAITDGFLILLMKEDNEMVIRKKIFIASSSSH